MNVPRATYRLQLHAGFGFNDAAKVAPYLAQLGVSHVYLSPIFKARPGSVHGYDVADHNQLNPELGTEDDFASMIDAFRRQGLGRILDIVPNHMGVWGADNPLWLDVLEWGPYSQYAGWFDIDWSAQDGKLLAPLLGAQYGEELRSGKLKLHFEADGSFAVWAYEAHKLPIHPLTFPQILGHQHSALDRMADLFLDLPQWRPQVAERARALKSELASLANEDSGARAAIDARVDGFNSDWRELDRLIREQFWRVAFHRVAEDEINYRRFFNINDLAGLRIEVGPVFDHVHARIFRMLESGEIDGLRIDHIDGLFDPKAYLERLRDNASRPFYLVVEKILAPHESLRADWPVEGTTGYDYANLALAVLIDPASEQAFTQAYHDLAGEDQEFAPVAHDCKLRIMDNEMASELNALGRRAAQLAGQSPMTADLTRALLQRAIRQVVANFPVYRTYLDFAGMPADADRRDIAWAMTRARRCDPDVHPSAFDFLQNTLMAETEQPPTRELSHTAALRFAMKVQQFSGPVMAKGVEDTAFYRYNRFVALNEVGGAPERFGLAPALFHKANAARAQNWPHAMLATATHDTKRGEDNRARLAVLSEIPEEWRRQVETSSRILRARRGDVERIAAPGRDDEYMLYQMFVGSWPIDMLDNPSNEQKEAYGARIHAAIEKSLREAKRRSSWAAPDADYEQATQAFAIAALRSDTFLSNFLPFVRRVARLGIEDSLVQTVGKLTAPGVPDIYQGSELWDLNLVDPDNRRPVDFPLREAAMADLAACLKAPDQRLAQFKALMDEWQNGRVKLAATALLLALRREEPELFSNGDYQPMSIEGDRSDWAFGYVRASGDRKLAVVMARHPAHRDAEPKWSATAQLPAGRWFDLFRGQDATVGAPLHEWLRPLPFAVLLAR
ncbi:MAG TPA: malto-oligosyltrehalose synthase [Roseiarcus sp.]